MPTDGGVFAYQMENPEGYEAYRAAGVMPSYPVAIRDGRVVVDATETRERLTGLLNSFREMGVDTGNR